MRQRKRFLFVFLLDHQLPREIPELILWLLAEGIDLQGRCRLPTLGTGALLVLGSAGH